MATLPGPVTRPLAIAAVLLGLLGLSAVVYGVLEFAATDPRRVVVGVGTAVFLLVYGALLLTVAFGVYRGRRWSRGPGVATSLIQLPVAWSFAGGETWWVAVILIAVSVAVLVCLLLRSSTAVFVPDSVKPDSEPG